MNSQDRDKLEKLLFCLETRLSDIKDFEQKSLTQLIDYILGYCFGTERAIQTENKTLNHKEVDNLLTLGGKVKSFCDSWENMIEELEQVRDEIAKQLEDE